MVYPRQIDDQQLECEGIEDSEKSGALIEVVLL